MAVLPNYDYDAENTALDQKAKIALALQQAAMSDPSQGLGPGVKLSPLAPFLKIAQAYIASKGLDDVKGQRAELSSRYKADAQAGLRDFINGISTTPGTVDPGVQVAGTQAPYQQGAPEGNNPSAFVPPSTVTPQDAQRARIEAVTRAFASNNPMLQQLAGSQLGKMMAPAQAIPLDKIFESASEPVRQWMLANPGQVPPNYQAKPDLMTVGKEDAIVNKNTGNQVVPGAAPGQASAGGAPGQSPVAGMQFVGQKNGFTFLKDAQGQVHSLSPMGQLVKVDNAPKTTVNLSPTAILQQGQKSGVEQLFKDAANKVSGMGDSARAAGDLLTSVNNLRQLDQNGIYSNLPAAGTTFFANLAQSVGVPVDTNKLANTEAYKSESTRVWQKVIAQAGGNRGITSQEAEQLKAMTPQDFQSPQSRQIIYGILENAAKRQQAQFQNAHKNFAEAAFLDDPRKLDPTLFGAFNPDPTGPTLGATAASQPAGTGGPMSLDDYLRKKGVR